MSKFTDSQRNIDLYSRRNEGLTLRAVGKEFSLSPERVRQICAKWARLERLEATKICQ